ncbi:hypothetical protein HOLleu_27714 [Holothuria leucospilota]|uniref:Uncharacterized protein n=1 Tax=Holothuria leucospilota TaxID=206669 RepID=A0A9Q1BQS6_HOLLE|nr:hypothetical protein HOLleu_27714 [Holothuria leucospilota]
MGATVSTTYLLLVVIFVLLVMAIIILFITILYVYCKGKWKLKRSIDLSGNCVNLKSQTRNSRVYEVTDIELPSTSSMVFNPAYEPWEEKSSESSVAGELLGKPIYERITDCVPPPSNRHTTRYVSKVPEYPQTFLVERPKTLPDLMSSCNRVARRDGCGTWAGKRSTNSIQ